MRIRTATLADWPGIRPFFYPIVAEGTTFTFPTDLAEPEGRSWWLLREPARTVVAVDEGGTVLGTAKMNRNHGGNAAHIASASYMVDPAHEGKGVGRALCEDSLEWASSTGYRAMQFNAVVESNTRALRLYRSLGFEIVGTLPDGFAHPEHGDVGLHILYRRL
ncbi:GNAT family N-acetyltransferase [Nocardiopsis kunsanensis]|uniref:N-acetyltransferase n=1 Tax=Nocardiopsis kunsanensis TaxID=141693 RepID=A0A918X6S0_9ACTN|nr:GNAT family N-acetyltransferase [Nocardiopsis kunsanensis]GHD14686.1 N-acetyltransferase [Nocardiopsis kunsanensis]